MKTTCRIGAAMIAWLAAASAASAQEIEWKQTLNMPKGQNISRDRADMLGIEFGDTYAEAKAKLEKLDAEGIQPKEQSGKCTTLMLQMGGCSPPEARLTEEKKIFDFRAPGHNLMTASYVGVLKLSRNLPGAGNEPIRENITLHLSAPPSGHQVVAMERKIYYSERDQPQIADLIGALRDKYKTEPHVSENTYRFQFNDGQGVPPQRGPNYCNPEIIALNNFKSVRDVNPKRDCDVVMVVHLERGISRNHARILQFSFGDNERLKANGIADYAYIESYIKSMQNRRLGATPKL